MNYTKIILSDHTIMLINSNHDEFPRFKSVILFYVQKKDDNFISTIVDIQEKHEIMDLNKKQISFIDLKILERYCEIMNPMK